MQTQSRLIVNGNGGSAVAAAVDEQYYEAVLRELTLGQELTGQLQVEALRALRGHGQAEATAAFILREVSRAFTVCISIMGGSAPAANAPPHATPAAATAAVAGAPRAKDDGVPRKRIMAPSPHCDEYQWRKYGQKRIMRTSFPRCYFRCSHHRERGCPATKQVQQHSNGGPNKYLVIYVHEHTCHHASPPAAEAARSPDLLDFAAGLPRQQRGGGVVQLNKEELEQQVLVSSLACVLQGSQCYSSRGGSPEDSPSQGRAGDDGASPCLVSFEAETELLMSPGVLEDMLMDYDMADTLYLGASSSYGLRDDDDDMLAALRSA